MAFDIEAVTRILEETAAEEILPRFQALRDDEIREKRGGELVTIADVEAEKTISRRLLDLLPGSHVVGEEATAADPGNLERLLDRDPVWVVDPIDGTGNFARGRPVFAVMAGLVRDGETAAAWIHYPVQGRSATAERGAGAWLAGRRLRVAAPAGLREMRGTLHAGIFARPELARCVRARRDRVGAIRSLSCAGHEYLRLATAQTHFSLFTKLMPWDHVPGTLIHREAGGVACTLDGTSYGGRSYRAPGLLIAPDEASWRALHEALFGAPGGG
ncbi:MAG: inositol monophosphatase family protein [Kiloniellaceae bacterium]